METSQLIFSTNHLTGFYKAATLVFDELIIVCTSYCKRKKTMMF